MLSPFPGMDPYLENPPTWPNFHNELISVIRADLNRQLRPRYVANIEERVYLSDENDAATDFVVPDIHFTYTHAKASKHAATGKLAVIEPLEATTVSDDEVHETYIEIVDVQNRAVITIIEVLSPTNKLARAYGRESYQSKRRSVMGSSTHLIEIDLLRTGQRIYIRENMPPYDYLVHVSRAGDTIRRATVWPIPISLPLPVIPVPLKKGDDDAYIELQELLETAYERGAFDLRIDYTSDPIPPLTPEQSEWARIIISKQIDTSQ